ncbi:MAG TPA: hypothetical protein VEZ91_00930 [Kurthia gibsonii]|nr:hypothetical protein [Kurthia gibsonii]
MIIKFEVEPDEELAKLPFSVRNYFDYRMNIFITKNGTLQEFCTSTFNAAILVGIAKGLIEIYDRKKLEFSVEMYESTLEYTFTYSQKLLTVKSYEAYNGETLEVLKCRFDEFVEAFVKEYEKYHKYILKNDPHAFENKHYCMMRDQINILNNYLKKLI